MIRISILGVCALLGSAPAMAASDGGPALIPLAPNADHYFTFGDGWEFEFLWLRSDETYTRVVVFDNGFAATDDRGRWTVRGSRLVLDSRLRLRNIVTPDFVVQITDACGLDMLPELRRKIVARNFQPIGDAIGFAAIRLGGPYGECGARARFLQRPSLPIDSAANPRSATAAMRPDDAALARMLDAIDGYIAKPPVTDRFEFDAYASRGKAFLVSIDPRPEPRHSPSEIANALETNEMGLMEANEMRLGEGIPVEATRDDLEESDRCDFPKGRKTRPHGRCIDIAVRLGERLIRMFPRALRATNPPR